MESNIRSLGNARYELKLKLIDDFEFIYFDNGVLLIKGPEYQLDEDDNDSDWVSAGMTTIIDLSRVTAFDLNEDSQQLAFYTSTEETELVINFEDFDSSDSNEVKEMNSLRKLLLKAFMESRKC